VSMVLSDVLWVIGELKCSLYMKASYGIVYMTCTVWSVGLCPSACEWC
jgi:hypothetical protein